MIFNDFKWNRILWVSMISILGCATKPHSSNFVSAKDAFIDQAFADLSESSNRAPASEMYSSLGVNLGDLNKIKPGKFETYVFPKISNISFKTNEVEPTSLGRPKKMLISLVAVAPCKDFMSKKLFTKLDPAAAFSPNLKEEKSACAIIEVTDSSVLNRNRAILKKGDELKVRIFIDSNYRIHALDTESYNDSKKIVTTRVKSSADSTLGSSLSMFPIDLPVQSFSARLVKSAGVSLSQVTSFDKIAEMQIRKMNQKYSPLDCAGETFDFNDSFGGSVKVGWCSKTPWPSFIDTNKYLAVTEKIEVKK